MFSGTAGISKSEVSRTCSDLDVDVAVFQGRGRPGDASYALCDAPGPRRSRGDRSHRRHPGGAQYVGGLEHADWFRVIV